MGCGAVKQPKEGDAAKAGDAAAPAADTTPAADAPPAADAGAPAAAGVPAGWRIKLGAEMPNFHCVTSAGDFMLHDYLTGDEEAPYTLFFSHPKDFTPVCTTELGRCEMLAAGLREKGVKLIGISCDSVESHKGWMADILHREKIEKEGDNPMLSFPIIADEKSELVTALGMLDPKEKNAAGIPLPARALVFIGPDKKVKYSILYPATTGRNFLEVLRAIDSVYLTAAHRLATPANWKQGERCIVHPAVSMEDANKFDNFVTEDLPSQRPYLRLVDCPAIPEAAPGAPAAAAAPVPAAEGEAAEQPWAIRLGAEMPNFKCATTAGDFDFHEFLDSDPEAPWTVLFSHPNDFTPVCTTELGNCETRVPEFRRRGVKMIGISCNDVNSHIDWMKDILFREGLQDKEDQKLSFPIIADESRELVTTLGMLDAKERTLEGMPLPARALVFIDPAKKVRFSILYPATTGRDFDEVLRAIDSVQLTAAHNVATPVDWKHGERVIVHVSVSSEDAQAKFQNFEVEDLPSKKEYLRTVDCPEPERKEE